VGVVDSPRPVLTLASRLPRFPCCVPGLCPISVPFSLSPRDVRWALRDSNSDMNTVESFSRFDGQSMKPGPRPRLVRLGSESGTVPSELEGLGQLAGC
jgi:hypothetical protein